MTANLGAAGARCRINGVTVTSQAYHVGSIAVEATVLSTGSTVCQDVQNHLRVILAPTVLDEFIKDSNFQRTVVQRSRIHNRDALHDDL